MPQAGPSAAPGRDPGLLDDEASKDVVLLKHPSGSQVVLVGVAHVSAKAQQDVAETITSVNPQVVVLELDKERYDKLLEAAESGDKYGLHRIASTSSWKIAKMSLTGDILNYGMAVMYVCSGAVMGVRPGGEFLAAHTAAEEVGAHVVLGDRDQNTTMQRLRYYTHHLTHQDSKREEEVRRLRRLMAGRPAEGESAVAADGGLVINEDRMPGDWPDYMRRGEPPPTEREKQVAAEVEAAVGPEDPWGLGSLDTTGEGGKKRLLELMRAGGCQKPESVLQAAMRMLKDGMDPHGKVSAQDLLVVRDCGSKMVEDFRTRAIKGDDAWMQRLELESVSSAKGAAGMEQSAAAMKKVVVEERDLILARRLWEAGLEANGQPVVGVVGAGHIRGIQKFWTYAGTPAAEVRVKEYLKAPNDQEQNATLTAITTGAVIAAIAYKRPKVAGFLVGAVTLATAPYLGFMIASMNRFGKLAQHLVDAADRADVMGDQGATVSGSGWGDSPSEWS